MVSKNAVIFLGVRSTSWVFRVSAHDSCRLAARHRRLAGLLISSVGGSAEALRWAFPDMLERLAGVGLARRSLNAPLPSVRALTVWLLWATVVFGVVLLVNNAMLGDVDVVVV